MNLTTVTHFEPPQGRLLEQRVPKRAPRCSQTRVFENEHHAAARSALKRICSKLQWFCKKICRKKKAEKVWPNKTYGFSWSSCKTEHFSWEWCKKLRGHQITTTKDHTCALRVLCERGDNRTLKMTPVTQNERQPRFRGFNNNIY